MRIVRRDHPRVWSWRHLVDLGALSLVGSAAQPMSVTQANVDECVAALVAGFPIEDIWLLEPARAKECHLDKSVNLIVIVTEGSEHHLISDRYREFDSQAG